MTEPEAVANTGAPVSDTSASVPPAPLDDVMMAMDVVDTLRHADSLVERELSSEERDRQLKERLRQIYAAQGIDVPDRILDEGVRGLKDSRFAYQSTARGIRRSLALLWVRRGGWGKRLAMVLATVVVAGAAYLLIVKIPEDRRVADQARELAVTLPETLRNEFERIRVVAKEERALAQADALRREGAAAVAGGDAAAARDKALALAALRERLEQAYVIRIVARPGEQSGVFRIPDANPDARNYYLIVEAVDAKGNRLAVPISSEEDNATRTTSTWGIRVDERTFARVRADKQDDGIIQNNRVGEKRPGELDPVYTVATPKGAILEW